MAVGHLERATDEVDVFQIGMRRVQWVRISISDDGLRAEVAGLAHRLPIIRPVPLLRAGRSLIRAGCPYVVRDDCPPTPTAD